MNMPTSATPQQARAIAELNERSREIFRQIVESYLATGEPVGSRNISRIIPMTLSPASVRNVMADLEEAGLIFAPHTSAGRLPTQVGLRFFVDALLELGDVSADERGRIEAQMRAAASRQTFETVLTEASAYLSGISRGAGVVVTTKQNARLRHVEFVRLDPARALVVLVAQDGSVENRLLDLPPGLPASALNEASNFLNARLAGRTLDEVRNDIEARRADMQRELDALTAQIVETGLATTVGPADTRQLIVRGQANLLEDLRAAEDLERIRLLFADLETQTDVIDLLARAENGEGRAHLHRIREPPLLDVRVVDDRRPLPRRPAEDRGRRRRDRPDTAQLCPHRADGRFHRPRRLPTAGGRPVTRPGQAAAGRVGCAAAPCITVATVP